MFATNAIGSGVSSAPASIPTTTPSILTSVNYGYGTISTCAIAAGTGALQNCALTGTDYTWNGPTTAASADGRTVFVTNAGSGTVSTPNNVVNCVLAGQELQDCTLAVDFSVDFPNYLSADTIFIDGNVAYVTILYTGQVKPQ